MEHLVFSSIIPRSSDLEPFLVVKLRMKARPAKAAVKCTFSAISLCAQRPYLSKVRTPLSERSLMLAFYQSKLSLHLTDFVGRLPMCWAWLLGRRWWPTHYLSRPYPHHQDFISWRRSHYFRICFCQVKSPRGFEYRKSLFVGSATKNGGRFPRFIGRQVGHDPRDGKRGCVAFPQLVA